MKFFCLLIGFFSLFFSHADGRPSSQNIPRRSLSGGNASASSYIIGGKDAIPGAWPWQLSLQYLGNSWFHTCGATLLNARYALCAAHCVIGRLFNNMRVIAGLHDRRDASGTQTVSVAYFKYHEQYDSSSFINDISVLKFSSQITSDDFKIVAATLPDDSDQFTGATCVLTGWGFTSHSLSAVAPYILQQANIGIITTADCANRMTGIQDAVVNSNHICAYDIALQRGSCNGDSGGPMHCPGQTGYVVAGVTSWGIDADTYHCDVSYPSVYTRTSKYLAWISNNTP